MQVLGLSIIAQCLAGSGYAHSDALNRAAGSYCQAKDPAGQLASPGPRLAQPVTAEAAACVARRTGRR